MKILAVCAHGLGSSFLMEMDIKKRKSAIPTYPSLPAVMPTSS